MAHQPMRCDELRPSQFIFQRVGNSDPGASPPLIPPNRRVRTRTHGGVTGKACESLPMSILIPLQSIPTVFVSDAIKSFGFSRPWNLIACSRNQLNVH